MSQSDVLSGKQLKPLNEQNALEYEKYKPRKQQFLIFPDILVIEQRPVKNYQKSLRYSTRQIYLVSKCQILTYNLFCLHIVSVLKHFRWDIYPICFLCYGVCVRAY